MRKRTWNENINGVLDSIPSPFDTEETLGCLKSIINDYCYGHYCELAEKCYCDAYINYSSEFNGFLNIPNKFIDDNGRDIKEYSDKELIELINNYKEKREKFFENLKNESKNS